MQPRDSWLWIAAIVFVAALCLLAKEIAIWVTG